MSHNWLPSVAGAAGRSKTTTGTAGPRRRIGGTAVVVGASMAGLCAARVLSDRFDDVVAVDRDILPSGADPRARVPQGRHPHVLLNAGARLLEGWFPGIVMELEARGGVDFDLCRDFYWYQCGGVARRPSSMLHGPAMSRPLLESVVRRRVSALPNVSIRERAPAWGLRLDEAGTKVIGVVLDDGTELAVDLVVDASGRQARSLTWLDAWGYDPPPTSVVQVDTRYVSRMYRRGDQPGRDWKAVGVIGDPASRRLAMALPIEGDRWIVVLGGLNGETAPTDDAGLLNYARSLESPVIADLIAMSEPVSNPVTYRFLTNQRRRIERLRRFPLGWVLLGDALCSFDPIYGQGMTSAAQQADILGRQLDRFGAVSRRFSRAYFRAASRAVNVPWSIAVGGDFAYPDTRGKKPLGTDLVNRYMEHVTIAGQDDDAVAVRTNEVLALLRRPEALLTPAFAGRVLIASSRVRRRRGRARNVRVPLHPAP